MSIQLYVSKAVIFALGFSPTDIGLFRKHNIIYVVILDHEQKPISPFVVRIVSRLQENFQQEPYLYESITVLRILADMEHAISQFGGSITRLCKSLRTYLKQSGSKLDCRVSYTDYAAPSVPETNYDDVCFRVSQIADMSQRNLWSPDQLCMRVLRPSGLQWCVIKFQHGLNGLGYAEMQLKLALVESLID